jgi:hypothetical protein
MCNNFFAAGEDARVHAANAFCATRNEGQAMKLLNVMGTNGLVFHSAEE